MSRGIVRSCTRHSSAAPSLSTHARARPLARPFASSSRLLSDLPPTPPPPPSSSPPSPPDGPPRAPKLPSPRDLQSLQLRLADARARAQKQLRTLLATLDSNARKQAHALSAAVEAWELERKLRNVGGKINEATGYEEIERLRISVEDKERALLDVRSRALELKKEYAAKVKLRADSQREVNDLLQRKSSWSSADVLRFTELVQQDHENEQAEVRSKIAVEAGEEAAEKGFQDFMQAILHRYHEEQVWSDKIRSLSTYGSLAITSLNVLLFIITLLLIEPWRRRRLVENVEERLRTNTQQGHEATLAQLDSLQQLFVDAQTKLDALTALATAPASSPAVEEVAEAEVDAAQVESLPSVDAADGPLAESEPEDPLDQPSPIPTEPVVPDPPRTLDSVRSLDDAWQFGKEKVEGHEAWAAGAAGAVGGVVIAAVLSALTR
ncbi:hypothetical protein JCM10212_004555 [Sporobolomyces blumeae]